MKTVLVYGDSLSWGLRPGTEERFARMDRWPTVMKHELGRDYRVVTEALCGRTTVFDFPGSPDRNGETFLPALLETHAPLDVVILMLGTNDLRPPFGYTPREAARGCQRLVALAQGSMTAPGGRPPAVLLLAPPRLGTPQGIARLYFDEGGDAPDGFGEAYKLVAEKMGCAFLDTSRVVQPSRIDGIHLDVEANIALGEALAPLVRDLAESVAV